MRRQCIVAAIVIAVSAAAKADDMTTEVERSVHTIQTAFNKGDVSTLQALMTEDHMTVLSYAQFSDAASQLKVLSEFRFSNYAVDGLAVKALSPDVALVTYRATIKGTFKGRAVPSPVDVTEVWVKRDAKWRQAAYIETPLQQHKSRRS